MLACLLDNDCVPENAIDLLNVNITRVCVSHDEFGFFWLSIVHFFPRVKRSYSSHADSNAMNRCYSFYCSEHVFFFA